MIDVRVRFAPSPTGPLHMGGVRTALYNWLFARAHGGTFILRIEDTDQGRFVEGAEAYIEEALAWCGLTPDEGVQAGGDCGPYRQSERTALYQHAVQTLLDQGLAYEAFDTPEELNALRKAAEPDVWQYDATTRGGLRNSLALGANEVAQLKADGAPFVVRFKTPEADEAVVFEDAIRGEVSFQTAVLDDKVLMKADGLPTYHLANVVDDHHMRISHVIRGEEWLPSAPLHVLLYRAFGWDHPVFAHLPLILKPTGNGKLSKRDGDAGGFPVFPTNWTDPKSGGTWPGYREQGYAPEAFVNMLLMLGWNPGDERELFTAAEAAKEFSLDRVVKSGARFNPDKAKWFQEQHLRGSGSAPHVAALQKLASEKGLGWDEAACTQVLNMMLERVTFLHDIVDTAWLHAAPTDFNAKLVKKKWKDQTSGHLEDLATELAALEDFSSEAVETRFKAFLEKTELGFGQVLLPFRIALTGEGGGPSMFDFAAFLGQEATLQRLRDGMAAVEEMRNHD
ncbi:MAG: glutamate--tRNA ligase [Flavobacteriales bacterium]